MIKKGCSRLGQADKAGTAIQKPSAKGRLQRFDALADNGLYRACRLCGAGEVAIFRDKGEQADGFQVKHHMKSLC
ncbi:hypothetical protein GCM10011317_10400 [Niveispirillum cyanobacteriorum]|nr:hypothetical protein GCM10011317_10400 [Niveispirillum cyanobacteriorum]